jgi:polysaccharide deacetylase 2 family uncharacterized protein YibQ
MRSRSSRRTFLKQAAFTAAAAMVNPSQCLFASETAADGVRPMLAVVIDDVGYHRRNARAFLKLGVPLTFSVLPQVPHSVQLAEDIHRAGHEIMLHQPMQPHSPLVDPGPGALYVQHTRADMEEIIAANLAELPFACGVNNHMGSLFTESRPLVSDMLDIFRQQSFFFVDSFTTSDSIAYRTARELNMVSAYRNVFIDNEPDVELIYRQLLAAKRRALRSGSAIAIGHPRPETVQALAGFLREIPASGIELVYASAVARRKTALTAGLS